MASCPTLRASEGVGNGRMSIACTQETFSLNEAPAVRTPLSFNASGHYHNRAALQAIRRGYQGLSKDC